MEKQDLNLLQQKVTMLRAEGKYKDTIEAGYELLKLGIELKDYKSILTAYINNAASFYCVGDIEEAFNCIDQYTEVCTKHGDEADWVNLYNVSFLLYETNKDYIKAKETLEKSIQLAGKLEKYNIVSNGYSNLSHVYMMEGNFEKALEMAGLGLEMAKLHKPVSFILAFRVKLNLAKSYIGLEDLEASKSLIDDMIHEPLLEDFKREKAQCYDLQGAWYTKSKLYAEAYESFTNAKNIVEEYNDVNLLKTIQEERCKLCELMNNVQLGYTVQKEYIALLNEISERQIALSALKLDIKHRVSAIKAKANIDYLTGLYNRSYLEETANKWLQEASINNESIQCLVLDIDNFKGINDEFGHLFGDEAIKLVSKACSSTLKENELIGRYGGDEFVVILRGATREEGLLKAKQINHSIRNLCINKDGKTVKIKVSIGMSNNLDRKVETFENLFYSADMALYEAKKGGKNQIRVSR